MASIAGMPRLNEKATESHFKFLLLTKETATLREQDRINEYIA